MDFEVYEECFLSFCCAGVSLAHLRQRQGVGGEAKQFRTETIIRRRKTPLSRLRDCVAVDETGVPHQHLPSSSHHPSRSQGARRRAPAPAPAAAAAARRRVYTSDAPQGGWAGLCHPSPATTPPTPPSPHLRGFSSIYPMVFESMCNSR